MDNQICNLVAPFIDIEILELVFRGNPKLMPLVRIHAFTNFSLSDDEKLSLANATCVEQIPFILHCRLFKRLQIRSRIKNTNLLTFQDKLKAFKYSNSFGFDGDRDTFIFFLYNIYQGTNVTRVTNCYCRYIFNTLTEGERYSMIGNYFLEKIQNKLRLWKTSENPPQLVGSLCPETSVVEIFTFERDAFMPLIISEINMNS